MTTPVLSKSLAKIIPAAAGATLLLAAVVLYFNDNNDPAPDAPRAGASFAGGIPAPAVSPADREADLAAILAETDPARRQELLRGWADGIETGLMSDLLARIDEMDSPELRAAVRQALLYSWVSRDLVAVTRWFGTLGPAHDLRQEAREQLVLALLQCDPEDVVPALQSLPHTTSRQLYGPYFRVWAGTDPAAAADMILRLSDAEPGNPSQWHDLAAQVAAHWIETDPSAATAWVQALPDGPARIRAQLQASYHWTSLDPVAASAHAAQAQNLRLIKTVAGKWAETDPASALAWAQTLPDPLARARATSGGAAVWAQTDPAAAAAYAAALGDPVVRADVAASVTSTWAFADPAAAGDWLRTLPADTSRDLAVGVLCNALRFTAPDQAFAWAAAIVDPEVRDHTLENTATVWMKADPEAAGAAVRGSALSADTKARLLGSATVAEISHD